MSTSPGQLSDNTLIVNSCSTDEALDLLIALDPRFETNPNNNVGNAVFLFTASGAVQPGPISVATFGIGQPKQQQLAFASLSVAANTSTLLTVKMGIVNGQTVAQLGSAPFSFSATAYEPGSGFATPHAVISPNQAVAELGFTVP